MPSSTAIHEAAHGVVVVLLGGFVDLLRVVKDGVGERGQDGDCVYRMRSSLKGGAGPWVEAAVVCSGPAAEAAFGDIDPADLDGAAEDHAVAASVLALWAPEGDPTQTAVRLTEMLAPIFFEPGLQRAINRIARVLDEEGELDGYAVHREVHRALGPAFDRTARGFRKYAQDAFKFVCQPTTTKR
jgi:hypothetical protein